MRYRAASVIYDRISSNENCPFFCAASLRRNWIFPPQNCAFSSSSASFSAHSTSVPASFGASRYQPQSNTTWWRERASERANKRVVKPTSPVNNRSMVREWIEGLTYGTPQLPLNWYPLLLGPPSLQIASSSDEEIAVTLESKSVQVDVSPSSGWILVL